MTDKQIIFKCDVDCIRKNTEECFELDCIKGQESILKQLQAKEQECEEWKDLANHNGRVCNERLDKIDELEHNINELNGQLDRLKQTLTEIKEFFNEECIICKENYINITGEICEECKYKDILQKISECEG